MHLLPQALRREEAGVPPSRSSPRRTTYASASRTTDAKRARSRPEVCPTNAYPSTPISILEGPDQAHSIATRPYFSPDPASAAVFDFYGLAFEDTGCWGMRMKEGWECAGTGWGEGIGQTVRGRVQLQGLDQVSRDSRHRIIAQVIEIPAGEDSVVRTLVSFATSVHTRFLGVERGVGAQAALRGLRGLRCLGDTDKSRYQPSTPIYAPELTRRRRTVGSRSDSLGRKLATQDHILADQGRLFAMQNEELETHSKELLTQSQQLETHLPLEVSYRKGKHIGVATDAKTSYCITDKQEYFGRGLSSAAPGLGQISQRQTGESADNESLAKPRSYNARWNSVWPPPESESSHTYVQESVERPGDGRYSCHLGTSASIHSTPRLRRHLRSMVFRLRGRAGSHDILARDDALVRILLWSNQVAMSQANCWVPTRHHAIEVFEQPIETGPAILAADLRSVASSNALGRLVIRVHAEPEFQAWSSTYISQGDVW
ncbi:hypothetical protein PAXRUDRAFT_27241 [Paxillus rubicundulus Ve08.2h10]|uniref:Unplaced genomic scaffold scaffold_640, whole genome shotgun sequence n=1 Tax=Paxillus rubicundulus Ve08.2h10 TaxID=930991 RepID=A0A0D0E263_9AGAM|nr:hypothetical protein PAXRUDRAFT_27241 [Paxillus rubicundulus Ve08.2h10]